MVKQGKIIVLDGLDGCGKSSQFAALGKLLTEQELCQCDNLQQALQYSGTILIRKNRVVIKPINNVTTKELQPIEIPFEIE